MLLRFRLGVVDDGLRKLIFSLSPPPISARGSPSTPNTEETNPAEKGDASQSTAKSDPQPSAPASAQWLSTKHDVFHHEEGKLLATHITGASHQSFFSVLDDIFRDEPVA